MSDKNKEKNSIKIFLSKPEAEQKRLIKKTGFVKLSMKELAKRRS